ncbi:MAG TPA: recombinase family protein, partial [Gemmataceae bacterium]|nr:recombinase family protein [Gemmataceae bacterium]
MTTAEPRTGNRPAKITASHLERWANIYVRQSEPQQVQRHRESAQVQANLRQRALDWGWPPERIRVLQGDQGRSGTSTVGRDDFAFLLSEVALGHVGLVMGFQINRLTREDEALCRLIKVCAAFDTLLADEDGLYHPLDFNDRILLTVKGLMGGIELHEIQQRMQAARLNRARRGEWLGQPPPGFVIGSDSKLQFDPDEQVQSVTRLILEQFARLGSISGLLRYLLQHHIEIPYRVPSGANRGQLQWHRPHRETLRSIVRRPAYAGAYTWGRRAYDPRRKVEGHRGRGRVEREPHDCAVFLPDNHPAYITWDQYQSNLQCLRRHRLRGPVPGPARRTVALLAGLVVCGPCGCRMLTHYTRTLRYDCQRHVLDYGLPACQSLVGEPLEQLVAEQILEVVTPAGLELSLRATAECQRERATLDRQWQQRLERARHDTARAHRQYDAVEPENRLVARTLERKWEEALLAQRALEEDYARFRQTQPHGVTAAERAEIAALAGNLPTIWHAPQTGVAEKRRIVRSLLERVVVWAPASSQEVTVHLHWSLGTVTEHRVKRPVRSWEQVAGVAVVRQQVEAGQAAGWSSRRIAAELNAAGYQTPRGKPFTAESVRQLRARGGLGVPGADESRQQPGNGLGRDGSDTA